MNETENDIIRNVISSNIEYLDSIIVNKILELLVNENIRIDRSNEDLVIKIKELYFAG